MIPKSSWFIPAARGSHGQRTGHVDLSLFVDELAPPRRPNREGHILGGSPGGSGGSRGSRVVSNKGSPLGEPNKMVVLGVSYWDEMDDSGMNVLIGRCSCNIYNKPGRAEKSFY